MSNIFNTYNQYPIDIVAGHDWHLTDKNGQTYLDFTSGRLCPYNWCKF